MESVLADEKFEAFCADVFDALKAEASVTAPHAPDPTPVLELCSAFPKLYY